jgi:hypothetical protein
MNHQGTKSTKQDTKGKCGASREARSSLLRGVLGVLCAFVVEKTPLHDCPVEPEAIERT